MEGGARTGARAARQIIKAYAGVRTKVVQLGGEIL